MLPRTVLQWYCITHKHNKHLTFIHSIAHRAMADVKAMEAVFSSDLMKDVLSKLSIQTHAQIVTYWQQKSKEWLSAQQFVTHMGRDCTRTMAVRLNEWGLRYDDLRDIFDNYKTDEASFHSHLLEAGVARRPWRSKLWQHFLKKQSSL